jgi:hypothetical protein
MHIPLNSVVSSSNADDHIYKTVCNKVNRAIPWLYSWKTQWLGKLLQARPRPYGKLVFRGTMTIVSTHKRLT